MARTRARLEDSMTCPRGTTPEHRFGRHAELISVPAIRAVLYLLCLVCLAAGCAKSPHGPPFEPAPPPPDHRGRVYLYRADDRGSLASVRITIDGLEVGRFRNNEYETLELPAGTHHLRAGLRGFGLLAWGWNDHRFRLKPGETAYLEISVRLTARSAPDVPGLEIPGRQSGAASENVFIVPRSAKEALPDLEVATRLARSGAAEN